MAYVGRGFAYGKKGDYDRAIADETQAILLTPQAFEAYGNRGIAYDGKGEIAKALADYRAAVELLPVNDTRRSQLSARVAEIVAELDQALIRSADQVIAKFRTETDAAGNLKHPHLDQVENQMVSLLKTPAFASIEDMGERLQHAYDAAVALDPTIQQQVAPAGRRVALVIGNSAHRNVAALNNPVNDAALIADALRTDGFSVTLADNLDRETFIDAIKTFATKADYADWAVVYFAGHGVELDGLNYLIPIDAKMETDRDVDFEAIRIGQVMTALEGVRGLRVLILDACRNNPFAMKRAGGAARYVSRGLGRIEPEQGTVIVYSARPGQVAADGDGPHSPFAAALARRLVEAGVEVNKTFRLVRDDVFAATGSTQEVFQDSSLPATDFFFRPQ